MVYPRYANIFKIEPTIDRTSFYRTDGLVEISLNTKFVDHGIDLINYGNNVFLDDSINIQTEKARQALFFIENQLDSISKVLEKQKQSLQDFKLINKSVNFDLEINKIVERISSNDKEIAKLEYEIADAKKYIYKLKSSLCSAA